MRVCVLNMFDAVTNPPGAARWIVLRRGNKGRSNLPFVDVKKISDADNEALQSHSLQCINCTDGRKLAAVREIMIEA
jgi:hypothetical protein